MALIFKPKTILAFGSEYLLIPRTNADTFTTKQKQCIGRQFYFLLCLSK